MKRKSWNSLWSRDWIRYITLLINIIILASGCAALRCRTDEGPSEFELKRVTRNCMMKFGKSFSTDSNEQDGQQKQLQQQYPDRRYGHNRHNYDDADDTAHSYGYNTDNSRDAYNSYNRNGNADKGNRGREAWDRDFDGMHGTNSHYDYMTQYSNDNSSDHRDYDFNQNRRRHNNNNNNNNTNTRTNVNNQYNQYNNEHKNYNSSGVRNKNQVSTEQDKLCVVHCFFEQMNMLNGNDYPDRYKVTYVLTRDIHDRELRSFFVDTIQECFRYLESERRRDKCQFSRDLVNCMTEYAQAYCEDWNEFHVIFN